MLREKSLELLGFHPDVEVRDVDVELLSAEQLHVLAQVCRCCQAMVDGDGELLRERVDPAATFTHMNGMRQSRDEFIEDVTSGALAYYSIRVERPRVTVAGNCAICEYASVLTARAYGARGVYRMRVTQRFEWRGDAWRLVDAPRK